MANKIRKPRGKRLRAKIMNAPVDEILPKTIDVVEKMAARGMTTHQIADFLSMGHTKLIDILNRHPTLSVVYSRARAHTASFVMGKLMTLIRANNTSAIIFYLKTQCGWRETHRVDGTIKYDVTESFSQAVARAPQPMREAIEKLDAATKERIIHQFRHDELTVAGRA